MRVIVENGVRTRFWLYRWCGPSLLKEVFPTVFSMASNLNALYSDYLEVINGSPVWNPVFCRVAFDWELPNVATLLGLIGRVEVVLNQEDTLVWDPGLNGSFSVSSCVMWVDRSVDLRIPWKNIWLTPVPLKIQFFMWIASLGKISTIDVLRNKGFILLNMCSLCKGEEESIVHLLLHCPFSWEVWFGVL